MEGDMVKVFTVAFGEAPTFGVRAPGRVNLIGEHVDYSGYGVLPMALSASIHAYVRPRDDHTLRLRSTDPQYPPFETDVRTLTIDKNQPSWYKYVLCGVKGAQEALAASGSNELFRYGMDVLVKGDIAPSAGLSSSSALVTAALLLTLHRASRHTNFSPAQTAELAASCERYIGTEGGGMDQAICILGQAGKALHIQFNPLRSSPVPLPPDCSFVVAHSGVTANKAAFASFNERVVECRLAAMVIGLAEGQKAEDCRTLGALQSLLGKPLSEMSALVEKHLHKEPYTRDQVRHILGLTDEEFRNTCLSQNTLEMGSFELRARSLHVFSEAWRVEEFGRVSGGGGGARELGRLMRESHASCRDLYACSCPQLDELVQAAEEAGSLGSRLTGAGWGGCSVSLVPNDVLPTFLPKIKEFYENNGKLEFYDKFVFISKPASGAQILE